MIIVYIVLALLIPGIALLFYIASRIFVNTLYRSPNKEKRVPIDNADVLDMKAIGAEFALSAGGSIIDVSIVNDGLTLYGQYLDFGSTKCAIILPGRTGTMDYCYYFSKPYADLGYNIFVADPRGNGLSDGKYTCAGVKEHKDVLMWIDYISDRFGVREFVLHGVCLGAATAVFAANAIKNPRIKITHIVLDGLYTTYYDIFSKHIIERKKPYFPFTHLTFFILLLLDGTNLWHMKPIKEIKKLTAPTLLIFGAEDFYCRKENNEALFNACGAETKRIKTFESGAHSFVRYTDPDGYDTEIKDFLR